MTRIRDPIALFRFLCILLNNNFNRLILYNTPLFSFLPSQRVPTFFAKNLERIANYTYLPIYLVYYCKTKTHQVGFTVVLALYAGQNIFIIHHGKVSASVKVDFSSSHCSVLSLD